MNWPSTARIIPSRYPSIGPFDRVSGVQDLEALYQLETRTNPRVRQDWGELDLVRVQDRLTGPGTTPIMAAFTHPNLDGSRFSDGSFGVYYTARSLKTAVAESVFARERFARQSHLDPMSFEMRVYYADLAGELVDLRGLQTVYPKLYDANSYAQSARFGAAMRANAEWGICYNSVRDPGGECAAVLRPPVVSSVRPGAHLVYAWNGRGITDCHEKRSLKF